MAGAFVAIGLTFMIFLSLPFLQLKMETEDLSFQLSVGVSFLPFFLSSIVGSFLVLRRVVERHLEDGLKVGIGAASLGLIVSLIFGTLKGGLWMIIGDILGGLVGAFLARSAKDLNSASASLGSQARC